MGYLYTTSVKKVASIKWPRFTFIYMSASPFLGRPLHGSPVQGAGTHRRRGGSGRGPRNSVLQLRYWGASLVGAGCYMDEGEQRPVMARRIGAASRHEGCAAGASSRSSSWVLFFPTLGLCPSLGRCKIWRHNRIRVPRTADTTVPAAAKRDPGSGACVMQADSFFGGVVVWRCGSVEACIRPHIHFPLLFYRLCGMQQLAGWLRFLTSGCAVRIPNVE